jgi:hypothetical protein
MVDIVRSGQEIYMRNEAEFGAVMASKELPSLAIQAREVVVLHR